MSTPPTNTQTQAQRAPLKKGLDGFEGMEVVAAEPNSPSSPISSSRDSRDTGHYRRPEPPPDNVAPVPRGQADSLVAHETSQHSSEPTRPTPGPIRESHTAEDSTRPFNASERREEDGVANPKAKVEGALSIHQGSAHNRDLNPKSEKMTTEAANCKVNGADAEPKQPSAPSTH